MRHSILLRQLLSPNRRYKKPVSSGELSDSETCRLVEIDKSLHDETPAARPPPTPLVPCFVDLPFGIIEHQLPIIPNNQEPLRAATEPDTDLLPRSLTSLSLEMGDNAHEVVDLTASTPRRNPIQLSSSPPTAFDAPSSSHRRQPATSRGVKRGNNEDGEPSASSPGPPNHIPIRMDLTVLPDSTAQRPPQSKRPRPNASATDCEATPGSITRSGRPTTETPPRSNPLLAYRCPICLERPINPTSAFCGHVFCHKCIWDHLEFSSQSQSHDSSKKSKGTCPVCRTPISRSNSGKSRGITPIIFQTKKREDPPPTS